MIEFVIRRRVFISMLFIGLSLLGYISYSKLPVELLPEIELPFLIIQVNNAREMDPDYVEKQAVIPLEGVVGTLEGIEKIESYVERSRSSIYVYYKSDVNLKYAFLKLQEKVDAIKPTLPQDFFVFVLKIDTEMIANMFMNLQIRGSGGTDRIRNIFNDKIRRKFEAVDGIANVELFGGSEKSVEIILNKETSEAYNITPNRVRSLIVSNNMSKRYIGRISSEQKKHFVNLIAEYTNLNDLANIIVKSEGPIFLKDVAEIKYDVKDETSISRVNGKEAVTVQLIRDSGINLIELSHITRNVIDRVNSEFKSQDIEIAIQYDSAEYLEKNIDLIKELAITGAILAVLILWFFLKNLRLVFVITLALPLSIFTAFNLFYAFDITLNSLTLVGMALAVGMLLDNSIVVLENIYRHLRKEKKSEDAAISGTKEVWRSIFAATLTTIIVFLPFIFASNFMVRILGYHIGVSIISTLLISLVVALLLIPMITNLLLRNRTTDKEMFYTISSKNRLMQIYTLFLKSTMRFPVRTIVSAVVIFFASALLVLAVSIMSQDEVELQDFNLYVSMPGGATLESTDATVTELEERVKDIEELKDIVSQIYEEEAILTLKLKDDFDEISAREIVDIKEDINERIDNFRAADVSFDQPQSSRRFRGGDRNRNQGGLQNLLGLGSQNEMVVIKGYDIKMMRKVADNIKYQLENLPTIDVANLNIADNRPEIHLLFDKTLVEMSNVSLNTVALEVSSFQKEIDSRIKFKQGIDEYDIIIRNENLEEKNMEDLKALMIPSENGAVFPLQQLSRIIYSEGSSEIIRTNQERQIEISFRFLAEVNDSNTFLESARNEINQMVKNLDIPPGIAIEVIHDETDLSDFYFLFVVAFMLIYMILAAVFESLLNPLVIMFTIPLAAIGSFWGIILTDNSLLNATTLIGFLILLGIVVNNGIILIDFARILRQKGNNRSRALITAGQARLRPILITAITTIVAMFPLAMGQEEYVTRIAAPFAVTVIGGLSLSTLFTLIFIPTVYSGLEVLLQWLKSLSLRLKLLQFVLLIFGTWLITTNIETTIWQFANFFLLLFVIPGSTYFTLHSLRQAKSELIRKDKPIKIVIKNLVKIYDQPGRFLREWNKNKRMYKDVGDIPIFKDWIDVRNNIWQYILFFFLIFYVYFYLSKGFWVFVLSHLVYFYSLYLLRGLNYLFRNTKPASTNKILKRINENSMKILSWGIPTSNLIFFYWNWENIVLTILIGIIWYSALTIYFTGKKLNRNLIDPDQLKGKLVNLRRQYYKFIKTVPVLGRKRNPFKALNKVSLEIESGMFGLLGPNGAGKTTLMRILCGILEQNYGTIHINNIDVKEKREEIQGLIGYLPQDFGTYENMTAYEFLDYQAILKNILIKEKRKERVNYVLEAVHLEKNKNEKIGSFSGGMKQRIGIAQTLLHLPRILVVDEPTAGLDPRERIRFRNLLVALSKKCVILFSTHIIEDVASSCDKVAVLNIGELKYLGRPQDMAKLAENNVWQLVVEQKQFTEIQEKFKIVHHAKVGNKIRIRCLSEIKPMEEAQQIKPTLEDAYLWLLSQNGNEITTNTF
jgi:multidrug efflux pump subunit AcrB/ABC-type multidrug transport system ATPase subunit